MDKKLLGKISLKEMFTITFGTFIVAVAVYFFMQPSQVSIGSGAALAMILANYIPLPVSTILLALNIILLIIGFLLVGPEFGAKTVYCAILMPLIIGVFEILFPDFQSITGDPLLDVVCYILVVGVGLSYLFSCNASSGGLDIVAKIMNKYLRMDLGQAMSISGMVVAAASALCYEPKIVVLSVLGTYFGGLMVDHFIFGLNIKRRVCILSPRVDDIVHYILYDLHSGASLSNTIGAYDNVVRKEIITIVDKQEYRLLMDYVRRVDPKAFVTVYSVSEVSYTPKKRT
ncbi:MAG: YitT family protein [Clostridia bacterium]|nr:YitT family protein [Clostridia bacterium]